MSTLFGLFARRPDEGRVKTGLIKDLGAHTAAKLYRSFIMDLCEQYAQLSVRSRVLVYAPRGARRDMELLASRHWRLTAQQGPTFGHALAGFFDQGFRCGYRRIVAMVTDCPTVPPEFVVSAFDRLMVVDTVLGPTMDGGVFLIGMSVERPEMFHGYPWDGLRVFDEMVERAEKFGLILGLVPHWYNVSDPQALRHLNSHLNALALVGDQNMPKRTQAVLQKIRIAE
ncbi:MAG: DUF2064 domain-containing protein [Planctomycetia bacterium]|nr:DUF2064 domain-containing protein [Planctomycetia bacterium]